MAFYKPILIYILGRLKVWAKTGVKALKTAEIRVEVLLPLVKALSTNSSLLTKRELWQVYELAIWFAGWVNSKGNYNFCFFKQAG